MSGELKIYKPDFARQNCAKMSLHQRKYWCDGVAEEAKKTGITVFRYSVDEENDPPIALVEGWDRVCLPNETTPPPFFFVTHKKESSNG